MISYLFDKTVLMNLLVKRVESAIDQGVIFDEKLLFEKHVINKINECFRMLGLKNRRAKCFRNIKSYVSLYVHTFIVNKIYM